MHSEYTLMTPRSGIERSNRLLLDTLHHTATGPFTAAEAAALLSVSLPRARRLLSYLASRGWLARVRRGLYTLVPLGATVPAQWREDPWVVATKTFAPCYIGGWSAGEHWGLTEQIFRDIVVVTGTAVRERRVTLQGTPFRLTFLRPSMHFGTRPVWRGQVKVPVSDPSRTLVDMLDKPELGGGIRHVAEILETYFDGEHRTDQLLLEYAERLGNRAVFKRLGYLIEVLKIDAPEVSARCKHLQSSGIALLDPALPPRGPIVKRWNLRANAVVEPRAVS